MKLNEKLANGRVSRELYFKTVEFDYGAWEQMCIDALALESELAAHLENEGDECPLCVVEAELAQLRAENADLNDTMEKLWGQILQRNPHAGGYIVGALRQVLEATDDAHA